MLKYTLDEIKQHRKNWVKALRSGLYTQGTGFLRDKDDNFCCLGVASDVCKLKEPVLATYDSDSPNAYYYGDPNEEHDCIYLSGDAMDYYGLKTHDGSYMIENVGGEESYSDYNLVTDNDDHHLSFDEIADIIEKEPKGLFKEDSFWYK